MSEIDMVVEQCYAQLFQPLYEQSPEGITTQQFIDVFLGTGQLTEQEIQQHFPFKELEEGQLISEKQLRKALKDDMMREILMAAGEEIEELKGEFVENADWEEQIKARQRLTTLVREPRSGFLIHNKDERNGARSQPVQHHMGRDDTLYASMYKPRNQSVKERRELDWEFVEELQERLDIIYKSEAISEVGERHSFLNLQELKYRKNPDIMRAMNDLTYVIQTVNHKPLLDKMKLTRADINVLLRKLKEEVQKQADERNQKEQIKMLIESLQTFGQTDDQDDSPEELLKDMFMLLIQEEKHKYYSPEDWFQLNNAIHQFLTREFSRSKMDARSELNKQIEVKQDHIASLTQDINSLERKLKQSEQEVKRLIEESDSYRSQSESLILQLREEFSELKLKATDLESDKERLEFDLQESIQHSEDLEKQNAELSDQIIELGNKLNEKTMKEQDLLAISQMGQYMAEKKKQGGFNRMTTTIGSVMDFNFDPDMVEAKEEAKTMSVSIGKFNIVKNQADKLTTEVKALKLHANKVERERNEYKDNLRKLEQLTSKEKSQYLTRNTFLEEQNKDLTEKNQVQKQQIFSLQGRLDEQKIINENLTKEHQVLKYAMKDLENKLARGEGEQSLKFRGKPDDSQKMRAATQGSDSISFNLAAGRMSMAQRAIGREGELALSTSDLEKHMNEQFLRHTMTGGVRQGSRDLNGRPRLSIRSFNKESRVLSIRSRMSIKKAGSNPNEERTFIKTRSSVSGNRDDINRLGEAYAKGEGMEIINEDNLSDDTEDQLLQNDIDHNTIMIQIKAHDAFFDREDRSSMYKEVVFFFKPAMNEREERDYDALNLETYIVLTKRYLYCVDLDNLEWLFDPIPIDNLSTMQLSLNNNKVAIFKRKQPPKTRGACPFVIIENDHMEEMIRFVKRTFQDELNIEYQDIFYFKTDSPPEERAFNIVKMNITRPLENDVKFADSIQHGFLEKMTVGWRSFFSSQTKITWAKQYYVLRNHTLYVFEKDHYDRPIEQIHLDIFSLDNDPPSKSKYNKEWVIELTRADESPICLGAENETSYRNWNRVLQSAIREACLAANSGY